MTKETTPMPARKHYRVMLSTSLFALMAGGGGVMAEEPALTILEPVVVTATRTGTPLSEAPAAVSVVTEQDMEHKHTERLGDALKGVTGVYMRGSASGDVFPGGSVGTVTMRGIPSSNRTLIAVDGTPLNSPYSGSVDYSALDLDQVERIEVVPGPFSSLYGGSAFAGVINAITKVPDKREITIKASLGGSPDEYFQRTGGIVYRDRIQKVGISAGLGGTLNSGYIDDYGTSSAVPPTGTGATGGWTQIPTSTGGKTYLVGDKGKKPWDQEHGHLTLYLEPNDNTQLNFGISRSQEFVGYTSPHIYVTNGAGNTAWGSGLTSLLTYTPSSEAVSKIFLRSESEVAKDTILKTDLSYSYFDFWYTSPNTTSATPYGGPGTLFTAPGTRVDGSVQLESPLGSWNRVTVGVAARQEDFRRRNYDLNDFHDQESKGAENYRASGTSTTYAAFIQDKIDLTHGLTAYLGGRYDYWVTQGSTQQWKTGQQTANGFYSSYQPRWDAAFSPKASLVYKPIEELTFRGSWGSAFRPPGLIDMYTKSVTSTSTTNPDPAMKPETVESWELGGEARLPTGTTLRATYFENQMKDLIYTQTISSTLKQKINAGKAMSQGVEFGAEQKVWGWLKLFANATYTNSEMLENVAAPTSVGQRLTYVPKWMANFGFDAEMGSWSGNLTGRYVSKVFGTDGNTDAFEGTYGMYDSYVTVDAKVAYEIVTGVKASFAILNMFDEQNYQYYRQPGRTFFAETSFKY